LKDVTLRAAPEVRALHAVTLSSDSGLLGVQFTRLRVLNGDIKLAGYGWSLSGYQEIDGAHYRGDISRQILELGSRQSGPPHRRSRLAGYHLHVKNLPDSYFNIAKPHIFQVDGDQIDVDGLRVEVPKQLTTEYVHGLWRGRNLSVRGVQYFGAGKLVELHQD
jgi:hypothetical protein